MESNSFDQPVSVIFNQSMDHFFDSVRQRQLDILNFKMLEIAVGEKAIVELAAHRFLAITSFPQRLVAEAFTWLDDACFGSDRIRFFSKNVQTAYEDFVACSVKFQGLIARTQSGDDREHSEPHYALNYTDMNGSQKAELSEELAGLARKLASCLENLRTIGKKELGL